MTASVTPRRPPGPRRRRQRSDAGRQVPPHGIVGRAGPQRDVAVDRFEIVGTAGRDEFVEREAHRLGEPDVTGQLVRVLEIELRERFAVELPPDETAAAHLVTRLVGAGRTWRADDPGEHDHHHERSEDDDRVPRRHRPHRRCAGGRHLTLVGHVEEASHRVSVVNRMSLRTAVAHRNLLYLLSMKELRTRYRKSVLGWTWSLLNPLSQMVIFTVVFLYIFQRQPPIGDPSGLKIFPLYFLAGLLPFQFFSISVSASIGSVQEGASLIKKVAFPHEHLVLSIIVAQFVTLMIELAVLAWRS